MLTDFILEFYDQKIPYYYRKKTLSEITKMAESGNEKAALFLTPISILWKEIQKGRTWEEILKDCTEKNYWRK